MTPFDFTKDILFNKQYVMEDDNEGEYVPFVANRVLSNYADCIFYVNEMNEMPWTTLRMQYDYYYHSIAKKKRPFIPYPKNANENDIGLIMEAYNYNVNKAKEAARVLTPEQIATIKKLYQKGGDG